MNSGMVYLVGAGPGDPELLTCQAKQCLQKADVVVYDQLACPSVLNLVRPDSVLIFAGKQAGYHVKPQHETNALLIKYAHQGKMVVRLKGGDPFVFGRGGEEAQVLMAQGVPFFIVPGVSSCYSVPAYAGIPVTHREYASSFHVITGHRQSGQEAEPDYTVLAKLDGTLLFLMSLTNLPQIAAQLMANGMSLDMPAAVIQQGTTACQKTVLATVATIADEVKRQEIRTPAMTVIGKAVSLRQELQWFERGALFGKKVIVTGTPTHAKDLAAQLRQHGADAAEISLIYPAERNLAKCTQIDWNAYTWAVLTSANGVELFFKALRKSRTDLRQLSRLKFGVIGTGTAQALEKKGIYADCIPEQFDSRSLAQKLLLQLSQADRVILLRAENGSVVLPELLQSAGIDVTSVVLYRTVPDLRKQQLLQWHLSDADYVVLASSSAANAYAQMRDAAIPCNAKIVSIGAVTTNTAEACGISVAITAQTATNEGIVCSILQDVTRGKGV